MKLVQSLLPFHVYTFSRTLLMNTHSRITLLLLSALLLPNVAWCWYNSSYRSQGNPSGYSNNYSSQSDRYSRDRDYDRHERNEQKYEKGR